MRKIVFLFSVVLFVVSCKKEKSNIEEEPTPDPQVNKLRAYIDTAASYSHYIYIWTDNLPDTYSYSHANLNAFMNWIRNYSTEPGFSGPVDRWSFSVKQSDWDAVSTGRVGDYGIEVSYAALDDLRVLDADKNGDAYAKGLRRGDRIIEVNGRTDIAYNQTNLEFLNNAFFRTTNPLSIKVDRGGTTISATLNIKSYVQNPFALDTVYDISSKKIGYLVYNSFLGDTTNAKNQFQNAFTKFSTQNVDQLVVDLRYNQGGYGFLSDLLANYIIPSGNDGSILNMDKFNDQAKELNDTAYVSKKGDVELNKVYIITSPNTASASEGLINTLKPYLDVVLIGDTTHGKPVGYFSIPVGDEYIFPVSIRSVNKNLVGNFFNGFAPNHLALDNFTYTWGDINENSLAKAISLITGSFNNRIDNVNEQARMRQAKIMNKTFIKEEKFGYVKPIKESALEMMRKQVKPIEDLK